MNCLLGVPNSEVLKDCGKGYINPPAPNCDHQPLLKKNYLSEYITKEEKRRVLRNLGLYDDAISWGQIGGYLENQTDLWEKLFKIFLDLSTKITKELPGDQATTQIKYENAAYPDMKSLQHALDQLLYIDLDIQLQCNPSIKEVGETVDSITFTWSYNKPNIVQQTFNKNSLNTSDRTYTLKGPFTTNTTGTVTANDGTKTFTKQATLQFYPGIYYGSSTIDDFEITDLTRVLRANRTMSVTIDGTDDVNTYLYICLPYTYGIPTFTVNGFDGGFELIDDNFQLDRYDTGNAVRYSIYKSDNGGLGVTTINIS